MHCLIRRITRKSKTGVSHSDSVVTTDSISIGRATDQDVFLPDLHVALRHAVIGAVSRGRFSVNAKTPSGVQINGHTTQAGVLEVGDRLRVGRTELRLLKPPSGADLALQVDEAQIQEGRQIDVGALSLRETWLSKRPWAWILFLVVLGFGLGVPFATIHDVSLPWRTGDAATGPPPEPAPWHLLGGDQLWDSGPMSRAHRIFGKDCGSCHTTPFQRVTDGACLDCHEGTPHHADDTAMLQTAGLERWRCADCHTEHNGSEGLIATTPTLCTDCHSDPDGNMPQSETLAVSGFGAEAHPQFRIRLVGRSEGGDEPFAWHRVRMSGAMSETNGLVFPHDVHLAEEGVEGPEDMEMLECADCHRPDPRDIAMQPTRFERDCQRCHRLDFEPNEPSRQLPHGRPDEVVAMLEEYYARVALAGGYRNQEADPPEIVRRGRPGSDELGERDRRIALDWSQEWAEEVATELFEYRTCKTCHEIERRTDAAGGWHVQPVALTQEWFPEHEFTHDPHLGTACTDCHEAKQSETSSDVLMPGLGTCLECHGGADASGKVASRCIDCHGFHRADEQVMRTGRTHTQSGER